jgi:hypothetical protein
MYATIPELESTKLPRGGLSMDTEAVGRIQVCTRTRTHVHIFSLNHTFMVAVQFMAGKSSFCTWNFIVITF